MPQSYILDLLRFSQLKLLKLAQSSYQRCKESFVYRVKLQHSKLYTCFSLRILNICLLLALSSLKTGSKVCLGRFLLHLVYKTHFDHYCVEVSAVASRCMFTFCKKYCFNCSFFVTQTNYVHKTAEIAKS